MGALRASIGWVLTLSLLLQSVFSQEILNSTFFPDIPRSRQRPSSGGMAGVSIVILIIIIFSISFVFAFSIYEETSSPKKVDTVSPRARSRTGSGKYRARNSAAYP